MDECSDKQGLAKRCLWENRLRLRSHSINKLKVLQGHWFTEEQLAALFLICGHVTVTLAMTR
ncbi:unnamed protein product [Arabis nemorensis]|uniref:Uncharacterized protein n=1 Tax=Arabis nemorensis TaxID=586526 RepID=A0A565BI17_9BRAS|nr:unnamed protein product [Arabis nemorensis]